MKKHLLLTLTLLLMFTSSYAQYPKSARDSKTQQKEKRFQYKEATQEAPSVFSQFQKSEKENTWFENNKQGAATKSQPQRKANVRKQADTRENIPTQSPQAQDGLKQPDKKAPVTRTLQASQATHTLDEVLNAIGTTESLPLEVSGNFTSSSPNVSFNGTDRYVAAYKVQLNQDQALQIDHMSTDFDAYLYLYAKQGDSYVQKDYNDDGGGDGNSRIVYTAQAAGDYYIVATTWSANTTGAFSVKASLIDVSMAIALDNFLSNHAVAKNYTTDLPSQATINLDESSAPFVSFGNGAYKYAAAYKMSLQAGQIVGMKYYSYSGSSSPYYYVYKKDGENYTYETEGYLPYGFQASEDGEYYFAITTANPFVTSSVEFELRKVENLVSLNSILEVAASINYSALPHTGNCAFTTSSPVLYDFSYNYGYALKISLEASQKIAIAATTYNFAYNNAPQLYLYKKEGDSYIYINYMYLYNPFTFEADAQGEYYLMFMAPKCFEEVSFDYIIASITDQTAVPFGTLITNATAISSYPANMSGLFGTGSDLLVEGGAYNFGNQGTNYYSAAYRLDLTGDDILSVQNSRNTTIYLYKATGDSYTYIRNTSNYNFTFSPDEAGNYYLIAINQNLLSTYDIKLNLRTVEPLEYKDITLPYNQKNQIFDETTANTVFVEARDQVFDAIGYKFTITERSFVSIDFESDDVDPDFLISTSPILSNNNILSSGSGSSLATMLDAGTYYITMIDDDYGTFDISINTIEPKPLTYTNVALPYQASNQAFDKSTTETIYIESWNEAYPAVGYSFTLTEEKAVSIDFSSNDGVDPYFFVSTSPVLSDNNIVFEGCCTYPLDTQLPLPAGKYYVTMINPVYGAYDISLSASESTFYTPITVPHQGSDIDFDQSTSTEIEVPTFGWVRAMGYKFTLTSDANISLSSDTELSGLYYYISTSPLAAANNLVVFPDNSSTHTTDIPLAAGTYYLTFVSLNSNTDATYNFSLAATEKPYYTNIQLPYEGTGLQFNENNTIIASTPYGPLPTAGFTFTLPKDTSLLIEFESEDIYPAYLVTTAPAMNQRTVVYRGQGSASITNKLQAGKYYLYMTSQYGYGSYNLSVKESKAPVGELSYHELDYSKQINVGQTLTGDMNKQKSPFVETDYTEGYAGAYSINLTAGKVYKFTYTSYISSQLSYQESAITLLTGSELKGSYDDFNGDDLAYNIVYSYDNIENTVILTYSPETTGNYRILLLNDWGEFENMYSFKVEELSDVGSLTYAPVSLPYENKDAVFDIESSSVIPAENAYYPAAGYRFTLSQKSAVHISAASDDIYSSVFLLTKDAARTDIISETGNATIIEELEAGTYYLTLTTNWQGGKYELSIKTTDAISNTTPITLAELLAQATALDATTELPFKYTAVYGLEPAKLVEGGNGFRNENQNYYALAYKLSLTDGTALQASNKSDFIGTYTYLYVKDGDGYAYVNGTDYLGIYHEISADGEYYIVFTTSDEMEKGTANIVIKMSEPAISVNDLLNEATAVTYAGLPFSQTNEFGEAPTKPVAGDGTFRQQGRAYYAMGYKVDLAAGQKIVINQTSDDVDAYLYLYCKDGESYSYVNHDDDGGNNSDSKLTFEATDAGTYYIIATTYSSFDTGSFTLKITTDGGIVDPKEEITGLSVNNVSISVQAKATDTEIKMALSQLVITATVSQGEAPAIQNSPMIWTINQAGTQATGKFTAPRGYKFANGIGSLTVNINKLPSGIDDAETEQLIVYTNGKTIYVQQAVIGDRIIIMDAPGHLYANRKITDHTQTFVVPNSGLYILRIGNEVYKVIVR
ncbi:hypothetical protein D0T49_09085 [Paludibacter sp. 221]|uniref:PPC domain-containing protein n=1 Tax=Paludibacter sp. 221 TaxID=2302939 RepID=UPI0013D8A4FB|nr:PPC domain-containing protein [Paludibacter sp. 221]NDV47197.1 hypothetical protein [Paludibacter sp. 221]